MQLFVKDLTVMDFSYLCDTRGMVGESWIVDVILHGSLNDESMVLDFSKVKKTLKRLIDDYVDHKLVVPADAASVRIERNEKDESVAVHMASARGHLYLHCPADAYAFVYSDSITMDSVRQYLLELIRIHMPDNVNNIELNLREEQIDGPYYHYSHGLKKHDGNCQRIAHGHRSRVDVILDEQVDVAAEEYWAKRFADIYIGTEEDLVGLDTLHHLPLVDSQWSADEYYGFSYEASQGQFSLIIAKAHCEMITTDTTVECLAQFMADEQARLTPSQQVKIFAYEGVGKGAIAFA